MYDKRYNATTLRHNFKISFLKRFLINDKVLVAIFTQKFDIEIFSKRGVKSIIRNTTLNF